MRMDLFFYTGKGNSLWTARTLAEELGEAGIHPISRDGLDPFRSSADAVGIIFPVHERYHHPDVKLKDILAFTD